MQVKFAFGKVEDMSLHLGLFLMTLIASATWQEEVAGIDKQVGQLQDLQDRYKSSANRNVNSAMRWQFQNENYLDARRAWDQAAQEKQKIREIQDQIDDLRRRRDQILKEHGQSTP